MLGGQLRSVAKLVLDTRLLNSWQTCSLIFESQYQACETGCQQVCCSVDLAENGKLSSASPAAILDALTQFRTQVRNCAKTHKLKPVLEECDR